MPAPANKAARRLLAAFLSLTAVALALSAPARGQEPPLVTTSDSQDSFYCEERRLGYWFYCTRPKPHEGQEETSEPAASATSQLDAITANLRELKAKALLGLGLAPRLVQLLATLFLQDPRKLGFKAAIDLFLGQADAQEAV